MHLYWRIQQDLNCLGETIYFHDPSLIRSLKKWVLKNKNTLFMAEGFYEKENLDVSLN